MTVELVTEDSAVCADYAARNEERCLDFSGYKVPEHTQGAIERYINNRLYPGSFLGAVLSNDLKQAVTLADEENKEALVEIVYWFYNRAPRHCWGSVELFRNYLNSK